MTVKVVGHTETRFTDDKTGELIEGTNVFYLHNDMDVVGQVAAKKFFRKGAKMPELKVGADYVMDFGAKGKLLSFELLSK